MISPCALITFGTKYLKQMDLYSGQPHFKHLAEFVKLLLLTPHCNSYCETVSIRKIFIDCRHDLGKSPFTGPFRRGVLSQAHAPAHAQKCLEV